MYNKFRINKNKEEDLLSFLELYKYAINQTHITLHQNAKSTLPLLNAILSLIEFPGFPSDLKNSVVGAAINKYIHQPEPFQKDIFKFKDLITLQLNNLTIYNFDISLIFINQSDEFFSNFPMEIDGVTFTPDYKEYKFKEFHGWDHSIVKNKFIRDYLFSNYYEKIVNNFITLHTNIKACNTNQAINHVLEKYNILRSIFNFLFIRNTSLIGFGDPPSIEFDEVIMLSEPIYLFVNSDYVDEYSNIHINPTANKNIDYKNFFLRSLQEHGFFRDFEYDTEEMKRLFSLYYEKLKINNNDRINLIRKMLIFYQESYEATSYPSKYLFLWQALELINQRPYDSDWMIFKKKINKLLSIQDESESKIIDTLLNAIYESRNDIVHNYQFSNLLKLNYTNLEDIVTISIVSLLYLPDNITNKKDLFYYLTK